MSNHAVEKLLYEICNSAERAGQYRQQKDALLSRFALTEKERALVRDLDVRGLMDHGVNPMLIMTTWNTLVGPDHIGDYLGRLNAPRAPAGSEVSRG
jgi:Aromatic-ring-opening dioxygenase LigAB, LigA subunit